MIAHVAIKGRNGRIWSLPKPNGHGHFLGIRRVVLIVLCWLVVFRFLDDNVFF